jgi:glycosyltransferase involved in cell wall biosynthesis
MLPVLGAHFYMPRGGIYPAALERSAASRGTLAGRAAARMAVSFDGTRRRLLSAERRILKDANGPVLVALSNRVATDAQRHYALSEDRLRIVRNGVDLKRLSQAGDYRSSREALGIPANEVFFLALAENHRLKGIPKLLEAFKALPDEPRATLFVVGGKHAVCSDPRIQLLGHRDDVAPYLAACDALVHPTYYDPSSRVVLEAIALAKPVLTTEWNGACDFLREGGGIIVVDPNDARGLLEGLQALLDSATRAKMSQALTSKKQDVSMERHAQQMKQLYEEIVK